MVLAVWDVRNKRGIARELVGFSGYQGWSSRMEMAQNKTEWMAMLDAFIESYLQTN